MEGVVADNQQEEGRPNGRTEGDQPATVVRDNMVNSTKMAVQKGNTLEALEGNRFIKKSSSQQMGTNGSIFSSVYVSNALLDGLLTA